MNLLLAFSLVILIAMGIIFIMIGSILYLTDPLIIESLFMLGKVLASLLIILGIGLLVQLIVKHI